MSKSLKLVLLPLLALPLLAHASCDEVKSQIDGKIKANGVAHYSLKVVSADEADSAGGKVVGNCENESKKIVYTRGEDGDESSAPAEAGSAPAAASSAG